MAENTRNIFVTLAWSLVFALWGGNIVLSVESQPGTLQQHLLPLSSSGGLLYVLV